ncbi:hypothetical protein ACFL4N_04145 [Thermodesulfobacteriota bacterium]
MKEYIIEQLRDRACVKGKQKTWISQLTDDQIYELYLRLRRNEPAKSIARHIQEVWKLNPKSSVHSTSQGILKFKKRIAHLILSPPPDAIKTSSSCDENKIDHLDTLEEMERLTKLQFSRIQGLIADENETGVKHTHMSRDIHALTALVKAVTKAKEWEIVYGNADPLRNRRLQQKNAKMDRQFKTIMSQFDEEEKFQLVSAIESFLEIAEECALEYEIGEDGEYHVVDK